MVERHGLSLSTDTVGRSAEWRQLVDFATNTAPHATLGLVWGRRRTGKSYLLSQLADQHGFYFEAIRGAAGEVLAELGASLGRSMGSPAPLELPDWSTAISVLMQLGAQRPYTVVLDEYPYLREESPELDSIIQRAYGPQNSGRQQSQCRLVLCGSAMSVMSQLLTGTSPLRGRAGMDLRIAPFGYRDALTLHRTEDLAHGIRMYSIIGGVAAYARDMVDDDLPEDPKDFDRWVAQRVLSPAAPLSREVDFLLSEDPTTSQARKLHLYHSALAGIAGGRRTPGRIADAMKVSGQRLDPILRALVDAEFIDRVIDPVRDHRPSYHPGDPIIRFHYAILRRHQARLRRSGADAQTYWRSLRSTFESQVVGPTFEAVARSWLVHHAASSVLGDMPVHVGSSVVGVDGVDHEVDLVVAADDAERPAERSVLVIGEAKSGQPLTLRDLERLRSIRSAMGRRAQEASLYLVGQRFSPSLIDRAARQRDVELVDLERLYFGT